METTREKLQEKINDAIRRNDEKITANMTKFVDITKNLEDSIITLNGNRPVVSCVQNKQYLNVYMDHGRFIHPHALTQMAAKFSIPSSYINELSTGEEWKRNLCSKILTEHFSNIKPSNFLLRSVNDELRGFLSDKYKRLNSFEIMTNFIRLVNSNGLKIFDMYVSDTKNWFEALDTNIIDIPTPNNGIVSCVFGLRTSNSDFGDKAFEISSYLLQVVCMNGMTSKNAMREVHLGKKLDHNIEYSQRTVDLDTATTVSAINDTVNYLLSSDFRAQQIATIQNASSKIINPDSYIRILPAMGMLKRETEDVKTLLMANRIEDGLQGETSLFKFCQAVSAVGREKEDVRRREIDEISGKLLEAVASN